MGRSRRRRRGAGRGAAPHRGLPGEHRPPPGGGVSTLRPANGTGTGTGTGPSALPADGGARLQTAPAMRLRAPRSRFKATPCRGWGERLGPPAAAPARRASRGATLSGEGASAEPERGEGAARRRPGPGKAGKASGAGHGRSAAPAALEGGGFPAPAGRCSSRRRRGAGCCPCRGSLFAADRCWGDFPLRLLQERATCDGYDPCGLAIYRAVTAATVLLGFGPALAA